MLNFVDSEVLDKTKPVATDILIRFEDKAINNNQFEILNRRLLNYYPLINPEYKIELNNRFDEASQTLTIDLIITIPDRLVPKGDFLNSVEIFADNIKGFSDFYNKEKSLI